MPTPMKHSLTPIPMPVFLAIVRSSRARSVERHNLTVRPIGPRMPRKTTTNMHTWPFTVKPF